MKTLLILSCNNDLGNCCNDPAIKSILAIITNILTIIQIAVPILLLLMTAFQLMQMVINPDEKNSLKKLSNKIMAAVIVFFIPMIVSLIVDITDESINLSACIKESKNIKLTSSTQYVETSDKESKPVISTKDYEKGEKENNNETVSSYNPSNTPISTTCSLGNNNVKLVDNDSGGHAKIIGKANNQDVINYAKTWLNKDITYKLGSVKDLTPGGTCDCSHFVYKVLKHFNIIDNQVKSTVWGSCNVTGTVMYSDMSKLVPGDVLFMGFNTRGVGHLELYAGNGETIGCNTGVGVYHAHNANKYTSFIHLTAYD